MEIEAQKKPSVTENVGPLNQIESEKIEEELYKNLSLLEESELEYVGVSEGQKVTCNEKGLMLEDEQGNLQPITLGELLTADEWGFGLLLDARAIDKRIVRQFLINRAINQLQKLHNLEIIESVREEVERKEELSMASDFDRIKLDTYLTKEKEIKEGSMEAGIIAEKMVRIMLKKIALDHNLDFQVYEADVKQDIEDKIDFIIVRLHQTKGIEVQTVDNPQTIAVQFTISDKPRLILHKQQQLARIKKEKGKLLKVDEFLLISVPLRDIKTIIELFKNKPSIKGPDYLWDQSTREQIFRKCLENIFTSEELDELCQRIFNSATQSQ